MGVIAWELRQDDKQSFAGGQFAKPDGTSLDIGELLKEGKGQIVIDEADVHSVSTLDSIGVLKRTKAKTTRKSED